MTASQSQVRYEAISRFPVVERDLAVLIGRDQAVGPILETITRAGQPLLKAVQVFDLYEGKGIDPSKKSVAFGLRFGSDRTLRDNDVDRAVSKVLKALEGDFDAQLR